MIVGTWTSAGAPEFLRSERDQSRLRTQSGKEAHALVRSLRTRIPHQSALLPNLLDDPPLFNSLKTRLRLEHGCDRRGRKAELPRFELRTDRGRRGGGREGYESVGDLRDVGGEGVQGGWAWREGEDERVARVFALFVLPVAHGRMRSRSLGSNREIQ